MKVNKDNHYLYHADKHRPGPFLNFILLLLFVCLIGCHHQMIPDEAGERMPERAPSWVIQRKDARYPAAFYLIGIGVSEEDGLSADESAGVDLVKQIEVDISGEESIFQLESGEKGKGHYTITRKSRVESRIRTKVETRITGLTISERWYDEREKRYYSLATLDREIASEILKTEINNEIEIINNLFSLGLEYERGKEPVKALKNYRKAYVKREALDGPLQRYQVIRKRGAEAGSRKPGKNLHDRVKPLFEIKKRLDNLIAGLKIVPVDGNNQKGVPGSPLADKLVVKIIYEEKDREVSYPVADVPVKFAFDFSSGEMDAGLITDVNGIAGAKVYRLDSSKSKVNTISAVINLEDFTELREKKALFIYHLPLPFPEEPQAYSWYEGTIRLAEEIISGIYKDGMVRVAVLDFVEARSEKRLILSRIIESDLRTTLAGAEDIIVIDTGNSEEIKQAPRERARLLGANFYLSGVYWLDDRGLRINAKLVDTDKGTLAATGRIIMTKEAIAGADLTPVGLEKEQRKSEVGYLPDPGPAYEFGALYDPELSYDLVLDKLYFKEEKEQQFTIDVWTDKKEYAIGDSLTIYLRSDKDCYLSLLDIGTSGKLTVLFPNSLHRNNFIEGGRTYSIPGDFWGFSLEVLAPVGVERIKAIATLGPFSLVESEVYQGFYSLARKNLKGLRNIWVNMKNLSSITWAQDYTEIRIYEKGADRTKRTRGLRKQTPDEPQPPIDIIGTPGLRKKLTIEEKVHRNLDMEEQGE